MNTLMNTLLYAGLSKEQFNSIQVSVAECNRKAMVTWSVIVGCFWIMSLLLSINKQAYALCRTVYVLALALCVLTLLNGLFVVKRFPKLLPLAMHVFELSAASAGIGIAFCQPDVRTATMIAIAIIVPVVFVVSTADAAIVNALTVVLYAILGKGLIEPEVYSWGLTNLIIFSLAGILIGHSINKARFERFVYADSVEKLAILQLKYAYYDQMTGVKNRRAYEEMLHHLEEDMPEELCIIMADLNGLKRTNDALGHEAGDELISGASECLTAAFGHIDTLYRIGGDEFCIILREPPENAMCCLAELDRVTAAWKGHFSDHLSISYGLSSAKDGDDLGSIIRVADDRMYQCKRDYYEKNGIQASRRSD